MENKEANILNTLNLPEKNYGFRKVFQGAFLNCSFEVAEHESVKELESAWQDASVWQIVAEEMNIRAGPADTADLGV